MKQPFKNDMTLLGKSLNFDSRDITFFGKGNLTPSYTGFELNTFDCLSDKFPPIVERMCLKVSKSESPGNIGRPVRSSAQIHPIDQISTSFPYSLSPTSSSGALYQRVDT